MTLPKIRHASKVCCERKPPLMILHVVATIPQFPASEFARERQELCNDVAFAVGNGREYDDATIHWTDDDPSGPKGRPIGRRLNSADTRAVSRLWLGHVSEGSGGTLAI